MKKYLLFIIVASCSCKVFCQNVGIGTTTPAEKLDVNGNINTNGQIKLNGNAGTMGQVLMKGPGNNPVWGDITEFKNIAFFECRVTTPTTGANNCTGFSWVVPAGVTTILVECWGGGGGGGRGNGGGGGGYISARLTVTPGTTASFTIGAGGNPSIGSTVGVFGGITAFTIGSITLNANGGRGGSISNPLNAINGGFGADGGDFSVSGISTNYIGFRGGPSCVSKTRFMQVSATEFVKVVDFGNGGDAATILNSGAHGGYNITSTSFNQNQDADDYATHPGGGGGADNDGGFVGTGGCVIIHY